MDGRQSANLRRLNYHFHMDTTSNPKMERFRTFHSAEGVDQNFKDSNQSFILLWIPGINQRGLEKSRIGMWGLMTFDTQALRGDRGTAIKEDRWTRKLRWSWYWWHVWRWRQGDRTTLVEFMSCKQPRSRDSSVCKRRYLITSCFRHTFGSAE